MLVDVICVFAFDFFLTFLDEGVEVLRESGRVRHTLVAVFVGLRDQFTFQPVVNFLRFKLAFDLLLLDEQVGVLPDTLGSPVDLARIEHGLARFVTATGCGCGVDVPRLRPIQKNPPCVFRHSCHF